MRVPTALVLLSLLACSVAAQSEVRVDVVSMPNKIYSLEPLYVLYSLTNASSEPVYLPAEGSRGNGAEIQVGLNGAPPTSQTGLIGDSLFPHAMQSIWLAPGERWLFLEDVGARIRILEGEATIRVVLSSKGLCGDEQVGGRHVFPLAPLHTERRTVGVLQFDSYRCWEGEVHSEDRTVRVLKADSTSDLEAEAALRGWRKLTVKADSVTWVFDPPGDLAERFPQSHFAYAALARRASHVIEKLRAVQLQPANLMNRWLNAAIGRDVLNYRSSCWDGQHLTFDFSLADLSLAPGLRDYLDQYEWALENRICPLRRAKKNAERGGSRPRSLRQESDIF